MQWVRMMGDNAHTLRGAGTDAEWGYIEGMNSDEGTKIQKVWYLPTDRVVHVILLREHRAFIVERVCQL